MNRQVGTKNKFGFALGHVLNDVCACMGITYWLVFFHKVLQFNHIYAGSLILFGQVADGFATVFVGIFSDKGDEFWLCTRFGNRKAWHLIGVVCVMIRLLKVFHLYSPCVSFAIRTLINMQNWFIFHLLCLFFNSAGPVAKYHTYRLSLLWPRTKMKEPH